MGSLVYFVEGPGSLNAAGAADLGLAYALDGGGVAVRPGNAPKGGPAGVYFAASGHAVTVEGVEFEPYPGKPGLWYGINPSDPPTPEDMARKEPLVGHLVKMGDGAQWLVPVARYLSGQSGFPRRIKWTPDGWEAGDIVRPMAAIWEAACRVWETLYAGVTAAGDGEPIEVSITGSEEADLAAQALGLNYRISPAEVSLLGIFTTQTKANVCMALVDWPSVEKLSASADPN